MGSPFMESPSDWSDSTDILDAQSGLTTNGDTATDVAPRDTTSPWRQILDTQSAANNHQLEWGDLLQDTNLLGDDYTQPNAVDATYRHDSMQSNLTASVDSREGSNSLQNASDAINGHDSTPNGLPANADGLPDSNDGATMSDGTLQYLLSGNFDFLDSFDDVAWTDFMAEVNSFDLNDVLEDGYSLAYDNAQTIGNAQAHGNDLLNPDAPTNGNAPGNYHTAMTNGNLPTDDVLVNGDSLLQDGDPLANGNLSAYWESLLADFNFLETPYLSGNDSLLGGGDIPGNGDRTVVNGDRVVIDDSVPANPHFPADNSLGDVIPLANGDNTMVNGYHATTSNNSPETPNFPQNDTLLEAGSAPGNRENAVANGDHPIADATVPTTLTDSDHLQTADGNASTNDVLENENVPVHGNPAATATHPALSSLPADIDPPADRPPQADIPLPAGSPAPDDIHPSIEPSYSDDIPQLADSPHQDDTPEDAVQERIEQLCRAVPFPTPTYAESRKCIIRPYHIQDAPALQRHANNWLISKWFSYRFPHPYTHNDARTWILNQPRVATPFSEIEILKPTVHSDESIDVPWDNTLNFVIASCRENEPSELLSGISVEPGCNIWNRNAQLSFWIAEQWWGRGIATSAVGIFLKTLFSRTKGLSRVTACTWFRVTASGPQANFPARKVLAKNGFQIEGCLRKSIFKSGDWWDQEVWGILREDVVGDEPDTAVMSGGPVQ